MNSVIMASIGSVARICLVSVDMHVSLPAKVRLITRAYRLDLFFAGSFDIIHMNKTAAVATLDKVLHIKVGIVIPGCHGMLVV